MAISEYLKGIRERVGHALLLVPSVTAIVFDEERRVLLARPAGKGAWVAPGGSIDPDETPADAVVRETWEETGLVVRPVGLLGVWGGPECVVEYANGDRSSYVMTVFECAVTGGVPRPDGEEIAELRWVAESELTAFPLATWARTVLPVVFRGRDRASFTPPTWRPPDAR